MAASLANLEQPSASSGGGGGGGGRVLEAAEGQVAGRWDASTRKRFSLATKLCNELMEAAEKSNLEAMEHLLEKQHVPVHWANADRQTAAHIAVANNNWTLLEYLMLKKEGAAAALVGAEDKKRRTPLHLAAALGNLEAVAFLIEKCKLPLDLVNSLEMSVLYTAAVHGQYRTLVYLVERGADVHFGTAFNDTPLHAAARHEQHGAKMVQCLVEKGDANVNARNVNGDTVLHGAVAAAQLDTVKYLVEECKLSPLLQNAEGENALYVAVREQRHQITEYMVGVCNLSWHRDLIRAYIDHAPENVASPSSSSRRQRANKQRKKSGRVKSKAEHAQLKEVDGRGSETPEKNSKREAKFERHLRALQRTMILTEESGNDAPTSGDTNDKADKFNPPYKTSLVLANVAGSSRM